MGFACGFVLGSLYSTLFSVLCLVTRDPSIIQFVCHSDRAGQELVGGVLGC